jgi:PHD/YefM family antitoxin component YafN of YafNO toxin-antitoxin module
MKYHGNNEDRLLLCSANLPAGGLAMTETSPTTNPPTEAETDRLVDAPNRVTTAELMRNFSELSDQALTEPLIITKNGRDRLGLIAVEDYHRLKRRERIVRRAGETPEHLMALIEKAEMDSRHDHLDALIEDWKP